MSIKAIIIDDESLARDLIKSYLKDYSSLEIIGECENGFDGIKMINEFHPDLIFLDIQMPKINGFEMLELLDEKPVTIFATAFNEFAIKAFEMNAIDYLLKPFSKERFKTALDKAVEKIKSKENGSQSISKIVEHVQKNIEILERVVVKSGSKIHVVPIDQINYLEAQDDYVMLYTNDKKHLKQSTMSYFEEHLDNNQFVRIHRSYIVKIDQIAQLELYSKESYLLILKNGNKLPVSKSGYTKLKAVLNL
jgi:two-component system, LytTR family, response regulator